MPKTTIVQDVQALTAEIGQLKEQLATASAGLQASEAAKAAAIAARDAAASALETAKTEHAAAIEKLNADATVARNELANEIAAHGKTQEDLKKARHALANPAFADAAARGEDAPTPEGGSAPAAAPLTQAQALAEYSKIQDPVKRAEYRSAHAKELGIA